MFKKKFSKLYRFSIATLTALFLITTSYAATNSIKPKKEWKVSAYLDGDSDIDIPTFWGFNKLEKIGSNEIIDIYAQLDRWESDDKKIVNEDLCIDSKFGTKRYHVLKDDNMQKINSKEIQGLGKEINMGASKNFKDFVEWVEKFESRNHMLVIKGHGYGIMIPLEQILSDYFESSNQEDSALSTYSIDKVFDKNLKNKLKVIVFDSCEKATIEVAYQLRDHANVMVASEDSMHYSYGFGKGGIESDLSGIEYDRVLEYILQNPRVTVKGLAEFIVDSYFEVFNNNPGLTNTPATLSAIDLSNLENFVKKFSKFSDTLIRRMEDSKTRHETVRTLKMALKETQRYCSPDILNIYTYVDLFDFLKNIHAQSNDKKVKKDLETLNRQDIVIKSEYKGENVKNSKGLSILFIEDFSYIDDRYIEIHGKKISEHVMEYYNKSDFAKKTRWDKVMELYQEYSKNL